MELSIIRRETTGACKSIKIYVLIDLCGKKLTFFILVPNVYNESETITKFEIMDGAPVRGLSIEWIQVYLCAYIKNDKL